MKMRQLEAFRATILHGTLSAAADSLRTSQPTITRLIADLEYSLQFPLLVRRKGRVFPTSEGIAFYDQMDELFDAFAKLRISAADIHQDRNRALRIISLPALSMTVVPEIIKQFSLVEPDVSANVISVGIRTYFNKIREADTDIAFGNQLGPQPGIEQVTLAEVDYVCVLPPGHRLATRAVVDILDLDDERIITPHDDEENVFHKHDELFESANISIEQRYYCQSSGTAYAMVMRGLGIAILEPFSATIWEKSGVITRPFTPKLKYQYSACFNKNLSRIHSVRKMLDISKTVFADYQPR